MPNSGDVVDLDLGLPDGREADFVHPDESHVDAITLTQMRDTIAVILDLP
jgi:hypothetical protein